MSLLIKKYIYINKLKIKNLKGRRGGCHLQPHLEWLAGQWALSHP